jgi:uncharacterized protein with HEPN domain
MTRDALVYIEDILESIARIEEYTHNLDEFQFQKSVQVQDAVIRRLEIMGEAVKNIPPAVRANHPDIPWKSIAGLRDVLIHAYFGVQMHRTWKVVREDLPALKVQFETVRAVLLEDNAT